MYRKNMQTYVQMFILSKVCIRFHFVAHKFWFQYVVLFVFAFYFSLFIFPHFKQLAVVAGHRNFQSSIPTPRQNQKILIR